MINGSWVLKYSKRTQGSRGGVCVVAAMRRLKEETVLSLEAHINSH